MKILFFLAAAIMAAMAVYYNHNKQPVHYGYPLRLDVDLAANFGEVRYDHFHMGLDLRTLGRENIPVYAADDGYVSRITVSEEGYGIAIYVTHSNGTTTLYGHLNRLAPVLQEYLLSKQRDSEKWEQDIEVPANLYKVRKNELIALSGNTGHSGGPHLHFEIIDTRTGKRLNPLLKGVAEGDNIAPTINGIYWYDRRVSIYKSNGTLLSARLSKAEELYRIPSPLVSLGIEASDKKAATKYTLGIYKAELYMDDVLKHRFSLDELSEKNTRYVNGCIDYGKMFSLGQRIQFLFTLPGNLLPAYQNSPAKGMLDISDGKPHYIKIVVSDAAGNRNSTSFKLQYSNQYTVRSEVYATQNLEPNKAATINTAHSRIVFQKNSFYDTVPLLIAEEKATNEDAASCVIKLSSKGVPIHDSYTVSITTKLETNSPLRKRTLMVLTSSLGRYVVAGSWKQNRMTAQFDRLGTIQLVTDTIPPLITFSHNGRNGKTNNPFAVHVRCNDNLQAIASFRGELDGQWVPFAKEGNEFTYTPDGLFKKGVHRLRITATDVAGNATTKVFNW